jgi:hypothetical protein
VVSTKFDWSDILQIAIYKRDCFTMDLICAALMFSSGELEINEDMAGWRELMRELPIYLPNCQSFDQWFRSVMNPPFALNRTTIFARAPISEEV